MKGFGFQIVIVLFFFALGWVAHWALFSLNDESARVSFKEPQLQFESEIKDELEDLTAGEEETKTVVDNTQVSPNPYQDLIGRLQTLVDDAVYMKTGSSGSRVGIVQEFLNIYEGKDPGAGVDNDYGPGTKSRVATFQTSEKISSDGQTGPQTYIKMIDWLKNQ